MTHIPVPGFSWTQPCCLACWEKENPGRNPVLVKRAELETCVYCGGSTRSGIYIRIDPEEAPHPTLR